MPTGASLPMPMDAMLCPTRPLTDFSFRLAVSGAFEAEAADPPDGRTSVRVPIPVRTSTRLNRGPRIAALFVRIYPRSQLSHRANELILRRQIVKSKQRVGELGELANARAVQLVPYKMACDRLSHGSTYAGYTDGV